MMNWSIVNWWIVFHRNWRIISRPQNIWWKKYSLPRLKNRYALYNNLLLLIHSCLHAAVNPWNHFRPRFSKYTHYLCTNHKHLTLNLVFLVRCSIFFQTEEASPSFQRAGSVGAGPAGKTDNQESDPASNEILTTFTNLLRQQINTATVNMLQGLVECESKKAGYRHEEPLYPQSDLYCKVNMLTLTCGIQVTSA